MATKIENLEEFQSKYKYFIVIKDRNKLGSAVLGYDEENEENFRLQLSKCLNLAMSPIQVVRLGGPNCLFVFSEYKPYFLVEELEAIQICLKGDCPGEPNPFLLPGEPPRYSYDAYRK